MDFYAHESCGKCTPCREGTFWLRQVLRRIEAGKGKESDMEILADIPNSIVGKAFCPLGDGAPSTLVSSLKYFPDEYALHISSHSCPYDRTQSYLFEAVGA
jgi:NADH-quinone oxidoreductase subunit F